MRAVTVVPEQQGSLDLVDVPEPAEADGPVLVATQAIGICGTDLEIVNGEYGLAPPGDERLILGHESLGRVAEAPDGSGFARGDLVVGIVRRPDPVPCPSCAAGEWDFCRNGRYTERGIKALHGYGSERWRIEPDFAVKLDLLAALLAQQRGYDVHVLDLATEGPKPGLVQDLGATYHSTPVLDVDPAPDIIVEATGVSQVVLDAMSHTGANGIVCLTGISSGGHSVDLDAGMLNRTLVLENDLVFGSVNANRRHYEAAAEALARADQAWLERLITRRVPLDRWREALERQPHDIKVVVELGAH
jgi:threonine dehydrogenase-like Zn-dependent dehydrogenase